MKTKKDAVKKTPSNKCKCGCGELCTKTFRIGHDARAKSKLMSIHGKETVRQALEEKGNVASVIDFLGWKSDDTRRDLATTREIRKLKAEDRKVTKRTVRKAAKRISRRTTKA